MIFHKGPSGIVKRIRHEMWGLFGFEPRRRRFILNLWILVKSHVKTSDKRRGAVRRRSCTLIETLWQVQGLTGSSAAVRSEEERERGRARVIFTFKASKEWLVEWCRGSPRSTKRRHVFYLTDTCTRRLKGTSHIFQPFTHIPLWRAH